MMRVRLAADLHRSNAFIPAGDDLPSANRKLERLPAVERAVELLTLGAALIEPAGVVHDASLAGPRRGAVPIWVSMICNPEGVVTVFPTSWAVTRVILASPRSSSNGASAPRRVSLV